MHFLVVVESTDSFSLVFRVSLSQPTLFLNETSLRCQHIRGIRKIHSRCFQVFEDGSNSRPRRMQSRRHHASLRGIGRCEAQDGNGGDEISWYSLTWQQSRRVSVTFHGNNVCRQRNCVETLNEGASVEKLEFMGATPDLRCGDSTRWEELGTLFVFVGSPFFAEIWGFEVPSNAWWGKLHFTGTSPIFGGFFFSCDDSPWQEEFKKHSIFVQTQIFLEK